MSQPEEYLAMEEGIRYENAFKESLRGCFYLMERCGRTCIWSKKSIKVERQKWHNGKTN